MRVVLDTNVLIAAFATRGQCAEVLAHCLRSHKVLSSEILLDELHEKLTRKLRFSITSAEEAILLLRRKIQVVTPLPLPQPVSRDPDDDWVLATALAGDAVVIVTGDRDLLVLEQFRSITIVSPSSFARSEGLGQA